MPVSTHRLKKQPYSKTNIKKPNNGYASLRFFCFVFFFFFPCFR